MKHLLIGNGGDLSDAQFALLVDLVGREVSANVKDNNGHLPDNQAQLQQIEFKLDLLLMEIEDRR